MESALTKMHNKEGAFSDFDYTNEEYLGNSAIEQGINKNSLKSSTTRYQTLMGPSGGNSLLDTNDMYYEDDEEGEQGGSIEGRYT